MDDLEKAILISFNASGSVDADLKLRATVFCQEIRDSSSVCSLCIERLSSSQLVEVQFWCLQSIHEVLRMRYSSLNSEEKCLIRMSTFAFSCFEVSENKNFSKIMDSPAFVKNKLAQVLVTLIYHEYPVIWSSVFVDFLSNLGKGTHVIDMFCRFLTALDEDIISQEYPRSNEEIHVAGRIKDGIRQQCVSQIVRAWFDIVSLYKNSNYELCSTVLDTMRRYISWIDIGLVANDSFIPLLFGLIFAEGLSGNLCGPAAGCILGVVTKKMDHKSKLLLLQNLQIRRLISLIDDETDPDSLYVVVPLLIGYASELLDCFKRGSSQASVELLDEVLPSVFHIMRSCEKDTTFSTVKFLLGYMATLKSSTALREKQLLHIHQILKMTHEQIMYDPNFRSNLHVMDNIGRKEEDRMTEFRKDLFNLFRSVGRVAPVVTQVFIKESLTAAILSNSERNVEEIEATLSLFYMFGESLTDEIIKGENGLLKEVIPMLLSTKLHCRYNRMVALVYLETVSRYVKFVQDNTHYIPMVLAAFVDERGMHNPNPAVRRKASYLFMKVVKLLKVKLLPFVDTILESLQDVVCLEYNTKDMTESEDHCYIFEVIGVLIGMEEVPHEKQLNYLSSLLTPLCQQVEVLVGNSKEHNPEELPLRVVNIQQKVMAINSLSKGFNERLATAIRPEIGLMFKKALDVLLQILVGFPKIEPLRSKVTSCIHQMVDTLGNSVFPYLPTALRQLLAQSEPQELVGFLVLMNQLICKFNVMVHDIVEEVFPAVASRIFKILPRDQLHSGPGSNTEEIREMLEIQRTFYTFLHVIATHNLSTVFLSPGSREYLDLLMQQLLNAACNHKDVLVRKACVQIFVRLIKDWCARPSDKEKVPGFQGFIIETFAQNCCLYSVIDKSFEFQDANALILLGEIVLAQKTMYEKFGDEFLAYFVSKSFSNAQCPNDLVEQYCQKLQGGDMKALRSCYQTIIENLRLHQNGSLVFR